MSDRKPKRVQMTRQRPWRAEHPDAVIVARPSKWGNCFRVDGKRIVNREGSELWHSFPTVEAAIVHVVAAFRYQIFAHPNVTGFTADEVRQELAGRDLACWCPLDQPCHADVLLEIANEPEQHH